VSLGRTTAVQKSLALARAVVDFVERFGHMRLMDMFKQVTTAIFGEGDEALKNRRNRPRIVCDIVVSCLDESGNWQAKVADIGIQGLRLTVGKPMKPGSSLLVSALPGTADEGRPDLRCVVAWCRRIGAGEMAAGLRYDDKPENIASSWVQYLLVKRHYPSFERQDRRVEAGLPVEIRQKGKEGTIPGILLDLSLGGAKIRVERDLTQDAPLLIRFGGGASKLNPVKLQAQVVARSQTHGREGEIYSIKFFPADGSEKRRLRRVLMTLLSGLRTDHRPKAASVRSDPRPAAPDPSSRDLSRVGQTGGLVARKKKAEKRRDTGVSKFLQTPVTAGMPSVPEEQLSAPLSPRVRELLSEPEPRAIFTGEIAVPGRSFLMGCPGNDLPEVELIRGWAAMTFDPPPVSSLLPDMALRPTEDFFHAVHPAMPGCTALCPLLAEAIPAARAGGLLWTSRYGLSRWVQNRRRPIQWLASTVKTRERLERRALTLEEKTFHYLGLIGLGGVGAVKSALMCSQIATTLARELGLDDPDHLDQMRMAALLKDVGEALLFVGLENKHYRDRVSLFLHGMDASICPLESLTPEWPTFRCPGEILAARNPPRRISEELRLMHPIWSEQILSGQGYPEWLLGLVRWHHEAMNGSGYPDGLQGEDIPWVARCVAVADAFSSLLGQGASVPEAMKSINKGAGMVFDPVFVETLQDYLGKMQLL
jgi:hypothetical protein